MNRFLSTAIALLLLFTCTAKQPGAPAEHSFATIYEGDGSRPAEGATVTFFEVGAANDTPAAEYVTDKNGRFPTVDLPVGKYDLWATKDTFIAFQRAVIVAASFTTIRDDTLEAAASISGIVAVQYPDDPRSVTVRLAGTNRRIDITDENGRFTLPGLAAGAWSLELSSTLPEYMPSTAGLTVAEGAHDTIHDTLRLFSAAIPFVVNIRASQDTLAGTIRILWDGAACKNIMDYVIYKASCADVEFPADPSFVTRDTFLIDSIKNVTAADPDDTLPDCFRYRIALRNREQEIGPARGYAEVLFAHQASIATRFAHSVGYPLPGCDSASLRDTVTIALTAKNLTRPIRSLRWYDPAKKDTIETIVAADTLATTLTDTIRYAFDSVGVGRLVAVALDNAGSRWIDTVTVTVIRDAPVADAGEDTGVFKGASVLLRGKGTDRFGTIVAWEWKIGDSGTWSRTSTPDTLLAALPAEGTLACSLAVIDDDGNRSVDAMRLSTSCKVQSIAMSRFHELILKTDSTLWASGSNEYGQLGDGTMQHSDEPVKIMSNVKGMAAGTGQSLILKTDGSLWVCGSNWDGQLGDGVNLPHPFPVPLMNDVQSIAAGNRHTLILKTDNTLWACGENEFGQLGDGTTVRRNCPVKIMSDVKGISAGDNHSLALATNGSAWAFGCNDSGQLGIGLGTEAAPNRLRLSPEMIVADVQSVVAGYNHSFFLKTDGTLWGCGANRYGQLGDGSMEMRYLPVRVMDKVKSAAAGGGFSLLILTDNTLLANGWNYWDWGQGTWEERYKSARVASDVQGAAASFYRSLIVKTDGSLWTCDMQNLTPVQIIPFAGYVQDAGSDE